MEEIGRRLRVAREAKGLSIQDVEDETRIRKKYIEALEAGRPADIPGEVYVKGFIRSYGNFLELDGEGMVEEYKLALMSRERQSGGAEASVDQQEPSQPSPSSPPARPVRPARERPVRAERPRSEREESPRPASAERPVRKPAAARSGQSTYLVRRLVLSVAVIALLGVGGWWAFGLLSVEPGGDPTTAAQKEPETTPPATQKQPDPPPPVVEEKPKVTMEGPVGEKIRYEVSASPAVVEIAFADGFPWMEAKVDGKVAFSGFPKGPVRYEGKQIDIIAGFMDGLEITINGQKMDHSLTGGRYLLHILAK